MFFLRAFASATKSFFSNIKKEEKDKVSVIEKKFPRFRASVDEGIGTREDGIYDYFCNICLQIIQTHRHHFTECQDYDLCESCLLNNINELYKYNIKTTIHNEQIAEFKEVNYLYNKIFNDYYKMKKNIITDFNFFLLFCNLKNYQQFNPNIVEEWLKNFNSYTLHLFTISNYYKRNAIKPDKSYILRNGLR